MVNFFKPVAVKEISIQSEKITETVQFVHVADTQYGTVTKKHMNKVLRQIQSLNPKFVLFVGDLIDFDDYKKADFKVFEEFTMPVYFVTGNHEYYHQPETMRQYLEELETVTVLNNQQLMATPEIAVAWIDYSRHLEKTMIEAIESVQINNNIYTILINHVPEYVEEAAKHGFDMQLYGHTHGGQIRPWTYLAKAVYKYGDGKVHTIGDTTVYTTQWAWLRGPRMRLWTQNEVVLITLEPK